MFPRDIVCLRNISINTLHKGDDDDDDDDDDNNNNNNNCNNKIPSTMKLKVDFKFRIRLLPFILQYIILHSPVLNIIITVHSVITLTAVS